ncbi:copia protein [Tanacetum coccineum]|uniref:Copia protein n=1 Tax=Tanacetum coccineum TaxID=301880 RepID=A0ABQ5G6N7_9ASTR
MNSLPKKWLTFSQGPRNANHTQTLNLADIYGRFVYEDTPKKNSDDEVDERTSEEYLRDLDIKYHERALLANTKSFIKGRNNFSGQKANENTECYKCGKKCHFARDCFSKTSEPSYKSPVNNYSSVSKGFQLKFTPKPIQSSSNSNNQADPKFQKDYKAEYKKIKANLALLEATPSNVQAILLSKDEAQESDEEVLAARDDMDKDPQDDKEVRTPSPNQDQPELSHVQESAFDLLSPDLKKFDNILPLTERKLIRDQTDKLVEASMSSLDRNDPATNQKLNEATETFTRISSSVTEVLFLVKGFDFSALLSTMKSIQDHAVKQEEASAAWMKTSTNMAWNLGSRMSGVKLSQTALKQEIYSLRKDTSEIKSMMTEMYAAFQGHSFLAPPGSVIPTLALTDIQANVEGENANTTATEEPPSHTEGETEEPRLAIPISSIPSIVILPTQAQPITSIIIHPKSSQATTKIDKGKGIATESGDDPSKKLVKASSIVRPDLDEPDKEEQIKKAEEEARLNAISKLKVIKVVREEANKLGIHPKEATTTKAGELFKKAQDAEHEVLKKQHTDKVRKSLELRKHKYDSYMWIVSSRLKPEPVIDIKIHPKTKPVVITSALPAPEQTPSQVLGRKQKHMELEPETRIPGLECNRALLENVPWSDIDKVGMEALVSYLVAASLVKSPENARFSMKLRKLIAEHPDQEKLKSKKVKLEALGYNMD